MPAEPTTPKGRRTRELLIDAGRDVFARVGYVNARMGDVATEADISMGGLYRYFKNKEDLFAQVIEDLHQELFDASRGNVETFKSDPYASLLESNRGYLDVYFRNRHVMRAFIQAAHVEKRFEDIWWKMRERHIRRFVNAVERHHGITEVAGVNPWIPAESVACMVEQSAYVWFAKEDRAFEKVSIDDAARSVTLIWHSTFFTERAA